jgi:hypothetical protein
MSAPGSNAKRAAGAETAHGTAVACALSIDAPVDTSIKRNFARLINLAGLWRHSGGQRVKY